VLPAAVGGSHNHQLVMFGCSNTDIPAFSLELVHNIAPVHSWLDHLQSHLAPDKVKLLATWTTPMGPQSPPRWQRLTENKSQPECASVTSTEECRSDARNEHLLPAMTRLDPPLLRDPKVLSLAA